MRSRLHLLGLLCCGLLGAAETTAPGKVPEQLRDVGIDQRLDAQVSTDTPFRDETGREVRLGDYFGRKPIVVALVYYECPMLCTLVLNGMLSSFRDLPLEVGEDFDVLAVSFNPREGPELAAAKKTEYVRRYERPGGSRGWHFLTGSEDSVHRLASEVGFRYTYDTQTGQFAHASAIMVLTPAGKVSRYLYGVEYATRDLRLALVEASHSRIGSPVDKVLLYCFRYDPAQGKYSLAIMNVIRVLGVATLLGLVTFMLVMFRRDRTVVPRAQGRTS